MSESAKAAENMKPSMKLTILAEMVIIKSYHGCSFALSVDEKFIVEIGVQVIQQLTVAVATRLNFAMWTDACSLAIDRQSWSVNLMPATVVKHLEYLLWIYRLLKQQDVMEPTLLPRGCGIKVIP